MVPREAAARRSVAAPPLVAFGRGPGWRWAALLIGLLTAAWSAAVAGGGAGTAWTHLFVVPVVVAAVPFGRRGAVTVALAAGVLSGPLLPREGAVTGATAIDWSLRTATLVGIGWLVVWALTSVERRYRDELVRQLGRELSPEAAAGPEDPPAEGCGHDLAEVLASGRFHPVFQPVYSLSDGSLVAVEALTRFDVAPEAPPDVWFARAARAGLGEAFELAAVAAALAAGEQLPPGVTLTVNCSPRTLRDPALLALVAARAPRRLIVEVTEHAVVDDYVGLAAAVDELRRHGVELAVDDAGAGFASFRHVVRLAPELIKLDLSLTQNLHGDPVREALADCLIGFARRTGSRLVAEGIEHPADLTTWVDLGADAGQGFLLGRPGPLPVDAVSDRVVRSLAE